MRMIRKDVAYLGYLSTKEKVKSNPAKIDFIRNFPEPKNTNDIKSFLGVTESFPTFQNSRNFLRNYFSEGTSILILIPQKFKKKYSYI